MKKSIRNWKKANRMLKAQILRGKVARLETKLEEEKKSNIRMRNDNENVMKELDDLKDLLVFYGEGRTRVFPTWGKCEVRMMCDTDPRETYMPPTDMLMSMKCKIFTIQREELETMEYLGMIRMFNDARRGEVVINFNGDFIAKIPEYLNRKKRR